MEECLSMQLLRDLLCLVAKLNQGPTTSSQGIQNEFKDWHTLILLVNLILKLMYLKQILSSA